MPVPAYQEIMLPLLRLAGSREEVRFREAVESIADEFKLTAEERSEMLPSGRDYLIRNRVGWATTYLKRAGLLEQTRHGYFRITPEGQHVLAEGTRQLDVASLNRFPQFQEWRRAARQDATDTHAEVARATESDTPEDAMAKAHADLQAGLRSDLLARIKACPPDFFEELVLKLLVAMGYGGNLVDAARSLGKPNDGGIDGIIKEDRLGLDAIYVQAKRWDGSVGRPDVQKFAGALQGNRARKGVMLTTSTFTPAAHDYVSLIDSRIVLIDGESLAQFMIDFGVGVSTVDTYAVQEIDSDAFPD